MVRICFAQFCFSFTRARFIDESFHVSNNYFRGVLVPPPPFSQSTNQTQTSTNNNKSNENNDDDDDNDDNENVFAYPKPAEELILKTYAGFTQCENDWMVLNANYRQRVVGNK
jgi:hypothetical protein